MWQLFDSIFIVSDRSQSLELSLKLFNLLSARALYSESCRIVGDTLGESSHLSYRCSVGSEDDARELILN